MEQLAQKKAQKQKLKKQKQEQTKLDPTKYFDNRKAQILSLKQTKNPYPYPHKFQNTHTIPQFLEKFYQTPIDTYLQQKVSVSGRITIVKPHGKNLCFIVIWSMGKKLQVYVEGNRYQKQGYQITNLQRGDVIGVKGVPCRTKTNQLSIAPGIIVLLSPCLHMLPESKMGLKDSQIRYRKRYLDLIVNTNVRDVFVTRSKVVKYVRNYLDSRGFLQVETPMMNMIPGGATARPFKTYHNDLKMDLYLRIAPQLFLKELIVGGLQRVYQIGKNFRNQSMDQTHNPQYTSCEFYYAYADFNDLMNLTQHMLSQLVKQLTGSYKIMHTPNPQEQPKKQVEIDFTIPWKRLSMLQQLQKCLKQKIPQDLDSEQSVKFFDKQCQIHKVVCSQPRTTSRLIDKLVGHFLQSQCLNPTFIIQHPQLMSPLAKYHRSKPSNINLTRFNIKILIIHQLSLILQCIHIIK